MAHLPPPPPVPIRRVNRDATFTNPWESRLAELVGAERAETFRPAPGGRRWSQQLIMDCNAVGDSKTSSAQQQRPSPAAGDQCQAMVWRISVALEPT